MARQNKEAGKMGVYSLRLPKDVMKRMKQHAENETRTTTGQITVALREWLDSKDRVQHQVQANPRVEVVLPAKTRSEEQRRAMPAGSPIPAEVAEQIMDDDSEGWEGTDLKTFAGTKVKV